MATLSTLESLGRELSAKLGKTRYKSFHTCFNEISKEFLDLRSKVEVEEKTEGYDVGGYPEDKELVLYWIIRNFKPRIVVETGVAGGVSAYFILKALCLNEVGLLISVDRPNTSSSKGYVNEDGRLDKVYTPMNKGVGWLVPQRYKGRWNLLLGDSRDILDRLRISPQLFLHDSDHSYSVMTYEYEWAYSKGTRFILSDDIWWNSAWTNFAARHSLRFCTEKFGIGIAAR